MERREKWWDRAKECVWERGWGVGEMVEPSERRLQLWAPPPLPWFSSLHCTSLHQPRTGRVRKNITIARRTRPVAPHDSPHLTCTRVLFPFSGVVRGPSGEGYRACQLQKSSLKRLWGFTSYGRAQWPQPIRAAIARVALPSHVRG